MIIDELVEYALIKASERKVIDVRAGLSYTGVVLDDGACGLAYTFRNELGHYCGIFDGAGGLIGRTCTELIPMAKTQNRLTAAIGLATINAVINDSGALWETGNVTEAIEVKSTDTFGMVGSFMPILKQIKNKTEKIYIFEQNVVKGSGLYMAEDIPELLPKCDIAIVTATSLINHTIDDILKHCANLREVCLVGPSTPMCPKVFKKYNITLLAGDVVMEPGQTMRIISQGGGTMALKSTIKHVLERL